MTVSFLDRTLQVALIVIQPTGRGDRLLAGSRRPHALSAGGKDRRPADRPFSRWAWHGRAATLGDGMPPPASPDSMHPRRAPPWLWPLQQVTDIARQMVGRWGMSGAIGLVAVLPQDGRGPLVPGAADASDETRRILDAEARRLVEDAYTEVVLLLRAHRDQLDALANTLIEHETLDEPEAYAAAGIEHRPDAATPAFEALAS